MYTRVNGIGHYKYQKSYTIVPQDTYSTWYADEIINVVQVDVAAMWYVISYTNRMQPILVSSISTLPGTEICFGSSIRHTQRFDDCIGFGTFSLWETVYVELRILVERETNLSTRYYR